ncbi:MAG: FAD-binding protein, partial [Alphaproteobacteria bacterium]
LLTTRLDRLLSFDEDTGELVAEAGVTFADLMEVFLPRGWMPPVTPGTAFATLGGAVANDVHGKNHDQAGSFGDHVRWMHVLLPSGDVVRVSPRENAEIFRATIAGIGLTGIILEICLHLVRTPSNAVFRTRQRAPSLDRLVDLLDEYGPASPYSVAWIDALAKGEALGRGILETARPSERGTGDTGARRAGMPFDLPGFALNRHTVGAFNALYYRRAPEDGAGRRVACEAFLYPLDGIANWNRIYGRKGFYQFQCVVPKEAGREALRTLLTVASESGAASFLAVLKTLGREGRGYLSFPMPGYTLALDFPRRRNTTALLARLEAITREHGGRIYLAKDACLSRASLEAMYPKLPEFLETLEALDPEGHMTSAMARRLKLRKAET